MAIIASIIPANLNTVFPQPDLEIIYADMYITLIDSATGQPVNGNNITVSYTLDYNGTITTNQVIIPGQSMLIYSGIIRQIRTGDDGTPSVEIYANFSIQNIGLPNPVSFVNICNLSIHGINIDSYESAPGANDAQITVVASSTYTIQYSIDNVHFQSSGVFSGLSGGLKTVYVTDDNPAGCSVNRQVTIPTVQRLLESDPAVTIGNNKSRWNAVFNPVVFTYQRKDFAVTGVTADGTTGLARVAVNTSFTDTIKGEKVYVNAGPYKGTFTVIDYTGDTLLLDTSFNSEASGFININKLKQYYKVLTRITYQDAITRQQNTITATNRPDNTGLVKADISSFLQSLLRAKDTSDFTQTNFRDTSLSASYQIEYAESWSDDSLNHTTDWVVVTEPYYVVYAAKQLGNKYGGNLAEYVPFKTIANGAALAKWVTDFDEPVYSDGYPFDIGFIYGEDLAGLDLYATVLLLDINKNPIGGLSPIYLLNEDGSFLLNQDSSKLIIANSISSNNLLAEHVGLNRLLINYDFGDDVYYFVIAISYKYIGEPSTFNYSLSQLASPYVDVNMQVKKNGVIKKDAYVNENGTLNMAAGSSFSVEAYTVETGASSNPKLMLTIQKNGVIVFNQTTAAVPGASLVYTGTVDIGAVYTISTSGTDGGADVTPVNIDGTLTLIPIEHQVFQDQIVRVDKSPDHNSVYLRWIGLNGAWNYYRFIYNQEISLDVQNATIIKNYVFDWENQDGIEEVIGKSAGQKIKVMAEDLSVADIKGLQSIKYSPKVQMLVNKNPVKWQTVVLNTATFSEYETLNGYAPFSVTFNLPSINIQTQ